LSSYSLQIYQAATIWYFRTHPELFLPINQVGRAMLA
jgi:hypothetical protein